MNTLRKLLCAVVLLVALGLSCFGQAQGCDPGETHTGPPCSAALITTGDSSHPGETNSPPAADPIDVRTLVEATLTALLIL